MYKKIILLFSMLIISIGTNAQRYTNSCPKFYIGISTGINNQTGLLGVNFDVPVTEKFSLGTGIGRSSWGFKTYFEGRFYFKGDCNRGWAIGTGVTYNTGIKGFETLLPTTTGDRNVLLDLNAATNVFVSGYRFFNLGKNGNRFYLMLGYSINMNDDDYDILSNDVLTSDGETVMRILTPGGFVFGLGFSFGLGGR